MSTVLFKRSSNIDNIPIIDGQLIFDELDNKIYMDNGNQRLQYGGDVSLISDIDYATSNNVFNALATKDLFIRKSSVVDNKNSVLAATESGLPVGCLAIQSIIGTTDYSSIGNTVSSSLVTLKNNINNVNTTFTNQLKANNYSIYMDYHDGKYGVNTSSGRGADTFIPFKGDIVKTLIGTYSNAQTIDLTPYGDYDINNYEIEAVSASCSVRQHGETVHHEATGSMGVNIGFSIQGTNLITTGCYSYSDNLIPGLSCEMTLSYKVYHLTQ